jgi:hypothetical protein
MNIDPNSNTRLGPSLSIKVPAEIEKMTGRIEPALMTIPIRKGETPSFIAQTNAEEIKITATLKVGDSLLFNPYLKLNNSWKKINLPYWLPVAFGTH